MNILVTGGAGYIGSVLVDYFFNIYPYVKICVVDNLMYKQDGLIPLCGRKNFDFIYGDVRDESLIKKHVDWADVVIPLAALVGMPACERDKTYAQQVNQDAVVLISKQTSGTKKLLLYPNTNSGYGLGLGDLHCTEETPLNPISTYGRTKCAAERAVLDAGGIAFRLATVFGVSARMRLDLLVNDFTYKALTEKYIVLFEKDFKRNYVHIKDVARAFCHMIFHYNSYQGEVFNLGLSDANLSKWELCQKIKNHTPFSIQVDEIGNDPDKRNYIVSNSKIEKTDFQTSVSLDDGIRELLKAYRIISQVSRKYANV